MNETSNSSERHRGIPLPIYSRSPEKPRGGFRLRGEKLPTDKWGNVLMKTSQASRGKILRSPEKTTDRKEASGQKAPRESRQHVDEVLRSIEQIRKEIGRQNVRVERSQERIKAVELQVRLLSASPPPKKRDTTQRSNIVRPPTVSRRNRKQSQDPSEYAYGKDTLRSGSRSPGYLRKPKSVDWSMTQLAHSISFFPARLHEQFATAVQESTEIRRKVSECERVTRNLHAQSISFERRLVATEKILRTRKYKESRLRSLFHV
eukprot:TRINITY_DN12093_c0_g11_i1.p1 TRINITY_DN12093_c0_g11~~TRINITY_DN12093_c0_g11_i1.p1  ORF type:complete len:262 (+),score=21.39 TRINITY_DN12093_c0_g11_i1:127-912(+)